MNSGPGAPADAPLFYLVAGEPSGDALGAGLMAALRGATGGRARFAGVGGERMAGEGLESLFPMSELSVMGVFEVAPRVPRLLRRAAQTAADAAARRPAAFVSIDAKEFSFRVARRLRRSRDRDGPGFPLVHMVAPTVWAWRPGRARTVARFLDRLLALFPFEPPYFERHGLATSFVGHPAAARPAGDGPGFRRRFDIPAGAPALAVLPGSRPGEVARLLAPFGAAAALLARDRPGLRVVVPTVPLVEARVRAAVAEWPFPASVVVGEEARSGAFAACDAALAASGTVTLELALAGVPTVAAYRLSPLSAPIGRLLVDREAVLLPNRLLERPLMPLFLQGECRPDRLAGAVAALLDDPEARARHAVAAGEAARLLRPPGGEAPARAAARAVLEAVAAFAAATPPGPSGASAPARSAG